MNSYTYFSSVYDVLTSNIDYRKRAMYFDSLIKDNITSCEILLDLGCGTGSLDMELLKYSYDIIGVDGSSDMLSVANNKKQGLNPLYLCQEMKDLDLYGTIDVAISALDTLNHITSLNELIEVFKRVRLFLNKGGLFIFDVNTVYKHHTILANNCFIYDYDSVFCSWQNSLEKNTVHIILDIFEKDSKNYTRYTEQFSERAYTELELSDVIKLSDFEIINIFEGDTKNAVKADTERAVYVLRAI